MCRVNRDLAACPTLEFVAECALTYARRGAQASLGNVQIIDWSRGDLSIIAQHGFDTEFLRCFQRVNASAGSACGRALLLRKTIIIPDVLADYRFAPYRAVAARSHFRAVNSVPLISSSGALYGILSTHHHQAGGPSAQQLSLLEEIATRAANRIVQLRSRDKIVLYSE